MACGLIFSLLERKGIREIAVFEFPDRQLESFLRPSPGVEIEQLRGNVANLLSGALASPGPLVGAELVQRRALRRCARVTRDEVQRVHRDIHAIAVHVLEHEEFAILPGHFHRLQADVTTDAIFLVYHGSARSEVLQVAQNRFRIERGAFTPTFLPRAITEQLRFGDERYARVGQRKPLDVGRDRQGQRRLALRKDVPSEHQRRPRDLALAASPAALRVGPRTPRR